MDKSRDGSVGYGQDDPENCVLNSYTSKISIKPHVITQTISGANPFSYSVYPRVFCHSVYPRVFCYSVYPRVFWYSVYPRVFCYSVYPSVFCYSVYPREFPIQYIWGYFAIQYIRGYFPIQYIRGYFPIQYIRGYFLEGRSAQPWRWEFNTTQPSTMFLAIVMEWCITFVHIEYNNGDRGAG
jgi:hypothetical protein